MADDLPRDVLPIPERKHVGITTYDAMDPETTYPPSSADSPFTGRVRWVQLDLGEDADDPDHQISEDERFRIAMARQ
jgi:arylsulfatase